MRVSRWFFVFIGTLLVCGCSSGTKQSEVSGTVRIKDGDPLPGGDVTFIPEHGDAITRGIGPGGAYRVPGLPLGPVKIVVCSRAPGSTGFAAVGKPGEPPPRPPKAIKIREKYQKPELTDLTYTVGKGAQTHNIELEPVNP
jgi:hypothetical protein